MTINEFKFDSELNTIFIDGYESITRTGNGIFSIGDAPHWNSFNDSTSMFSTNNLTIGSLGGLLKATAGVVSSASSGTDYEPPVTKGNLTESGSSIIIFGGSTTGNVIGSGTTIQIKKASASQDGYLGKDDFVAFSAGGHNPVTLAQSSITGGLSLNVQEISFRAADTNYDGYLKSSDWDTFNNKMTDPMSVRGDIVYRNSSNVTDRLPIGADGYFLSSNGNDLVWTKSNVSYISQEFTNQTSVVVNHNLGEYPVVQVLDSGNEVIIPQSIINNSTNSLTVSFSAATSGTILITLGVGQNTGSGSSHNPVTLAQSSITGGLSLSDQEISFRAASTSLDGYLKHADWNTFNGKQDTITKYDLSETLSGVLTISGGSDSILTNDVTIQVKKASASQDGYLGKDDFVTFSAGGHNPVTLAQSSVTGGLSLNDQEVSFRAANTSLDGYLKHVDWNTFNSKEPAQTKGSISETASSVLTVSNGTSSTVGPNVTIQVKKSSASQDGYLAKGDWTIFNNKVSGPVGSDTYVQYNDNGLFGAEANFTWDKTKDYLKVGTNGVFTYNAGQSYYYGIATSHTASGNDQGGLAVETAAGIARLVFHRCSNTVSNRTAVINDDVLGTINFLGHDGTEYEVAGVVRSVVDGTVASNDMPGRLVFMTRPAGSGLAVLERMRITSAGYIFVGTTSGLVWDGTANTFPMIVYGSDSSAHQNGIVSEGTASPCRFIGARHNNTYGTKTAVASGDTLSVFTGAGWDGGTTPTYKASGQVRVEVDGTVSEDIVPGRVVFNTMNTSGTIAERIRITSAGLLGIANTSPSALLTLGTAGTTAGTLSLAGATSGTCTVQVAAAAGTTTFQLPVGNGTNGYYLKTDGSGLTSWAAVSATPAGSSYQVQYNNAGSFGASANFAWDGTSRLTLIGDGTWGGCNSTVYATSTSVSPYYGFYRYNGSKSSPAAVTSNTILGELLFHGATSSEAYAIGWRLGVYASGTWSSTTPSYMSFKARANGVDDVQILKLDYAGNVGIGTHTSLTERLDLQDSSGNGAIRIGNTAGTNAGTIKYTSNTFSGYNGSTWVNFGGGAPSGSTSYIQFNTSNAFDAEANFTWDKTKDYLKVGTNGVFTYNAGQSYYYGVATSHTVSGNDLGGLAVEAAAGIARLILHRCSNTVSSRTTVVNNDVLGTINFLGHDGTEYETAALVRSAVDGTVASNDMPGRLEFMTRPAGSGLAVLERARITNDGRVLVGTTTSTGAKVDVLTVEGTYSYQSTMYGTDQNYGCYTSIQKSRGSVGGEATVADGDPIGGFSFRAYGSAFTTVANIRAVVSGTVSGNNIPTRLDFLTHNGTSNSERMRLTSTGNLFIGTTAGLNVSGTVYTYPLVVYGSDSNPQFSAIVNESSACTARFNGFRHNGSMATKTAVASGDALFSLNCYGWDGGTTATYVNAANIQVIVDGTVSEDLVPGRIVFNTRNTSGTFAERMRITSAGGVAIGVTSLDANYLLQLPNSSSQKAKAYSWDTYACSELWKTNIIPIPNSLDKINSLRGITFNYNYPEENHPMNGLEGIGITAEELESLGLPNLVTKDNDTYTSINLPGIIPVLVEAIKELKARIEVLEQLNKQ